MRPHCIPLCVHPVTFIPQVHSKSHLGKALERYVQHRGLLLCDICVAPLKEYPEDVLHREYAMVPAMPGNTMMIRHAWKTIQEHCVSWSASNTTANIAIHLLIVYIMLDIAVHVRLSYLTHAMFRTSSTLLPRYALLHYISAGPLQRTS